MDLRSSWPPETGYYIKSSPVVGLEAVFSVLAFPDGTVSISDGVASMLLGREHSNWFFTTVVPADFNIEFTMPSCSQ